MNKQSLIIKAELIDTLLSKCSFDLIISDLPFLKGNRLADLVAIKQNTSIGFEIKSANDSLTCLQKQISDYIKVFNMVYIVIADKFYNHPTIKSIPKSVGIITVSSTTKKLYLKRKAFQRLKLDRQALLSLLWKKDLILLTKKNYQIDINTLQSIALKYHSTSQIQQQVFKSLKTRYFMAYQMFLKDRDRYTSIEDLRTITGLKKNLFV